MSTKAPARPTALDPEDPALAARAAGLRYVNDSRPGISRKRTATGFRYLDAQGRPMRDEETLARIKALAIPPAWTDVWICPSAQGHIQATGRDEKGRKQYRYHARWREVRDDAKYGRMAAFGKALPAIRAAVDADLKRPGMPRRKVLAAVVQLLELSLIRVGNEEYARTNKSFGLTTMRNKHVAVEGPTIQFQFKGKSGVRHKISIKDARLARIVARCQDLPGQELFTYIDDDGEIQHVDSADVNEYLREATGEAFTAKDFRTWAGTVLATIALREFEAFDSDAQAKRNIVQAVERVAERLGNTPSVCRKCYIHPAVVDAYLEGSMLHALRVRTSRAMSDSLGELKPEEAAVLALLQNRLAREDADKPKAGRKRAR